MRVRANFQQHTSAHGTLVKCSDAQCGALVSFNKLFLVSNIMYGMDTYMQLNRNSFLPQFVILTAMQYGISECFCKLNKLCLAEVAHTFRKSTEGN